MGLLSMAMFLTDWKEQVHNLSQKAEMAGICLIPYFFVL